MVEFVKSEKNFIGGKNEKQIWFVWGGVLTTLILTLLFSFASCDNGSTSSPPENNSGNGNASNSSENNSDIDYSLGTPPAENLKIPENNEDGNNNFSTEENADGIFLKFSIPKDARTCCVDIDGIGSISRFDLDKTAEEADFFYPFVDKNTEYTVRVEFKKAEEKDSEGYVIGDETIRWFEVRAKSGANSKGLVRVTNVGEISVQRNGDFKYTKKPTFYNKSLLTGSDYDWQVRIGLVEGISWLKPDRRTKWLGEMYLPNTGLDKTYNLYDSLSWGNMAKIDFIEVLPIMQYKYKGKTYDYRWQSITQDIDIASEAELWKNIDFANYCDKLVGNWTTSRKYGDDYNGFSVVRDYVYEMQITTDKRIIEKITESITKQGDVFTEDEKETWTSIVNADMLWWLQKEENDTDCNFKVVSESERSLVFEAMRDLPLDEFIKRRFEISGEPMFSATDLYYDESAFRFRWQWGDASQVFYFVYKKQ